MSSLFSGLMRGARRSVVGVGLGALTLGAPALVPAAAGFGVAATALTGCQKYDQLVEKDQIAEQKWSDYQAELERRSSLVPNIVETVKAAAKSEGEILTKVQQARSEATSIKLSGDDLTDPAKVAAFEKAQENLKGSLSRLMMVQEKYPELQSQQGFRDLRVTLESTENRILRARGEYNKAVREYNTELGKVSGSVVNKATGKPFKPRVYFQASAESQAVPKVSF